MFGGGSMIQVVVVVVVVVIIISPLVYLASFAGDCRWVMCREHMYILSSCEKLQA